MLNSKQIVEKGLITNIKDPQKQVQQVGVDLTIKAINQINGGVISVDGKVINEYTKLEPVSEIGKDGKERFYYNLEPLKAYAVSFNEDCEIPSDAMGRLIHKSTLIRIGSFIVSAIFDPGFFSVDGMGSIFFTMCPIKIEFGASICQMYFHENTPVEEDQLYNGNYQGAKDVKAL